jgi:hypothetical protein
MPAVLACTTTYSGELQQATHRNIKDFVDIIAKPLILVTGLDLGYGHEKPEQGHFDSANASGAASGA